MTKREAVRLAKRITRDDPRLRVTGYRVETVRRRGYPPTRVWGVDIVDTRTGYPRTIYSLFEGETL